LRCHFELRITNYEFQVGFSIIVILCALFNSAEISFAQDNSFITPEEIDLLPYRTIFQTETTKLNVERKRDALLELRNYRTAAASRIAVAALKIPRNRSRDSRRGGRLFAGRRSRAQSAAAARG
jgi:hypothetical protein